MNTPEKIRELAWKRIAAAKTLYDGGNFEDAYYIAGYSVELMLKAVICTHVGIDNLFDEDDRKANAIDGIGDVRRAIKTHNLGTLLLLSGLRNEFDIYLKNNPDLFMYISDFFLKWNESCRYKPIGYVDKQDVEKLIISLNCEQGVLKWIEKRM